MPSKSPKHTASKTFSNPPPPFFRLPRLHHPPYTPPPPQKPERAAYPPKSQPPQNPTPHLIGPCLLPPKQPLRGISKAIWSVTWRAIVRICTIIFRDLVFDQPDGILQVVVGGFYGFGVCTVYLVSFELGGLRILGV